MSYRLEVESADGWHEIPVATGKDAQRLTELLRQAHLPLNTRCGLRGLCSGCTVELLQGTLIHHETGAALAAAEQPLTVRACEYRLGGDVRIHVPGRSLLAYEPQVVTNFRLNVPRAHDPLCQELPAGVAGAPLGVAIDIGTTTVALMLVDLRDDKVLHQSGGFNRQMQMGDDVLTRINLCMTDPAMLPRMQEAVVQQTIKPLLEECLQAAGAAPERIACMTVGGNTTMLHLLAGVDPSSLGVAPFTPVFLEHRMLPASAVGLQVSPTTDPVLHLLPGAAAYIGSDLCAGILASGLVYDDGPSLLVDVGTNGEIILKADGHLLGCATAAGPAFEGSGLISGMRAGDGAVSRIRFNDEPFAVETEWIGQERRLRPTGICGSAYIDFLAEARRIELLNPSGRFERAATAACDGYFGTDERGLALKVARGQGRRDIVVTEPDIASLMQAKAAVAAGILILLERAGRTAADIKTLYLAGGFGLHLDVANAIGCGLLPGFVPAQVQVVGNTSLAGAYLALLDSSALDEMERIRRRMDIIELNLDPGFEFCYIEQLLLP